MPLSEITGTETVTSTEWSLVTDTSYAESDGSTDDGVVQLYLDLDDMVAGDELQIRFYEDTRSGDTQRTMEEWSFFGDQPYPGQPFPHFTVMHQWDFTAKVIAGTSIIVTWSIRRIPVA